jgi:exodeoxyribonuclease VII large subunit
LESFSSQIDRLSPLGEINNSRQRLDELSARLERGLVSSLKGYRDHCSSLGARLGGLNPESILLRGYAVVTAEDGSTIYQVGQVESGKTLNVRVSDGNFDVTVE